MIGIEPELKEYAHAARQMDRITFCKNFTAPVLISSAADLTELGEAFQTAKTNSGLEIDPEVPRYISSDPVRLRQVLTNLVNNAIKFTKHGSVTVKVSVQEESEAAVQLLIAVTDTGIGIPPDKIASIFDKFTQADASTTREYGGTGLGLAICKELVELMGGAIEIESEVSQGSRF